MWDLTGVSQLLLFLWSINPSPWESRTQFPQGAGKSWDGARLSQGAVSDGSGL